MKIENPQQAEFVLHLLLEWIGRLEYKRIHKLIDYQEELEYFILIAFVNRYHSKMQGEWKLDKKRKVKPKTIKVSAYEQNVLIKYGVVNPMKVELSSAMIEELERCNQLQLKQLAL
jgi:hypothetical protein